MSAPAGTRRTASECPLAERLACAKWLLENGDYEDWSAETHAAYEQAMRALAEASCAR